MAHETLRDYAHQTFTKGQKTLEALPASSPESRIMLGHRLRIHPGQWPENHHYLPSAVSIIGGKAASSFIVLLSKNRIGLLTAGARDGNRSRNLQTIGDRNREFMGDFLDMP